LLEDEYDHVSLVVERSWLPGPGHLLSCTTSRCGGGIDYVTSSPPAPSRSNLTRRPRSP